MQKYLYIFLFLLAAHGARAQQMPERSQVRKGNREYNRGEYQKSIERYGRALMLDPQSFEATYNLGNALYKAEMYDKATQVLMRAAADSLRSDEARAEVFYNLGNALFKQQQYSQALESYKQSLRLNPSDPEAKYNYAYTKRLLDKNGGGGGNDRDQDQNKDQNQDQDRQRGDGQDDRQNPSGQGKDPSEQQNVEQSPEQQSPEQEGQGEPQSPGDISEQEQEQMLDAIQAQEDKTQEKLKEKRGVIVRGKKNW